MCVVIYFIVDVVFSLMHIATCDVGFVWGNSFLPFAMHPSAKNMVVLSCQYREQSMDYFRTSALWSEPALMLNTSTYMSKICWAGTGTECSEQ